MAEVILAAAAVVEEIINVKLMEEKKNKRKWVRNWVVRRNSLGANSLLKELATEDPKSYFNFLRIDEDMFNQLLHMVSPMIQKEDTVMRNAIPSKLKLQLTLRYLATGDSFSSLQYLYRLPVSTISKFIPEVLDAIYNSLIPYIQVPKNKEDWLKIADAYNKKWNFPMCVGALDGKHISIKCPNNSGSLYYNYKGHFSIVLLALVDHNYNFLCIDVGSYGTYSDGGIFSKSHLKEALENGTLDLPTGSVIVGDDAFPLKPYLMKPYPRSSDQSLAQKIYNYRHCRARRIVENAFGILSSRFRIFTSPIQLAPEKAVKIVKAACALHNWIRKSKMSFLSASITVDIEDHESGTIIPGSWRADISEALVDLAATRDRNYTQQARLKRDQLAQYFINEGAVEWQYNMINN